VEFAGGEGVDEVAAGLEPYAGGGGDLNGAVWSYGDFGGDDVLVPVTFAGGDVARKREIRKCGHGDVVGAADAGFEHATAPDGNVFGLAEIVDAAGFVVAADAAEFNVDDFTGAESGGGFGLFVGVDALIETDGRLDRFLDFDVTEEVVPAKGLLDHHEVEGVELFE